MTTPSEIHLYNTAARRLELFRPVQAPEVKIYTCGPTVYSTPHIGNFAAYIYWDLLVRMLMQNGYAVRRVLNLTDVGHLVSDGDEGEDKLEKGARRSGQSVWQVAEHYIGEFQQGFRALNLQEPAVWARATDYIDADMALVDTLTQRGYTYETRDGIYFDTSKFPRYAEFAHLDLDNLRAGARVEFSDEKRHASDFAVWKFIQPGEQHAMRWDYLGRPGYPGWHLECSSIIHAELGEPIDIHAGGIDHIPVHHTNEIAQSEAAFGLELAKYWLHCDFLTVDGQKISKSLGNVYTLADLAERGYAPLDFKMWVYQGHYQSERDFTLANLDAAHARRLNWRNRIAECYQSAGEGGAAVNAGSSATAEVSAAGVAGSAGAVADAAAFAKVLAAVNNNLGSPEAFALIDAADGVGLDFWRQVDELFGLGLIAASPELTAEQQELLAQRAAARAQRDYAESDRLRAALAELNLAVLDTPAGQVWHYLN